jgi:hypothetical protein
MPRCGLITMSSFPTVSRTSTVRGGEEQRQKREQEAASSFCSMILCTGANQSQDSGHAPYHTAQEFDFVDSNQRAWPTFGEGAPKPHNEVLRTATTTATSSGASVQTWASVRRAVPRVLKFRELAQNNFTKLTTRRHPAALAGTDCSEQCRFVLGLALGIERSSTSSS